MVCEYKKTEIGLIPLHWEIKRVGEVAVEKSVRNKKNKDIPALSVTKHKGIVLAEEFFSRKVHSENTMNYKIIERGQFAYATIHLDEGSLGILRNCEQGIISPMYTVFEVDTKIIDSEFLFTLLKSKPYIKRYASLGQGSINRRMSIPFKVLAKFPIHYPPIEEQKKIVEILSSVENAIEKTEAIIKQTETVKKGLMQQLLTKGIGHTEFKETELGVIPSTWEVLSLGEVISDLKAGVSVNSENRTTINSEPGVLKTSSVSNRVFNPNEHKAILPEEYNRATVNPKKDHIIISRMNTPLLVGSSSYVDNDYPNLFLPDRLWQATMIYDRTWPLWLSFLLTWTYMRDKIGGIATGTSGSMKNISKQAFLTLNIGLPPLDEQKKISDILQSLDNRITAENSKIKKLEKIKTGLMANLLSGKIRVNIDQLEEVLA
ncbi:restriction endonuclease subunit S [Paenibacillus sp. NPDC057934]|uniref:restriction endonuclease subunit S n=1 Tax=Paenibacillus sp. NPDC057934 TaxID=3346282 RepID=UPI0036DAC624